MINNIEDKVNSEISSEVEIDKDKNYTTGGVAKICNVSSRTVAKWFDSGRLKGYRVPMSKDRRFPGKYLAEFVKEHKINEKKGRFYTTGKVSKILSISRQTIIRCFDAGEFGGGYRLVDSRFRRIPHESLIKFAKRYGMIEKVEDYFGCSAEDL